MSGIRSLAEWALAVGLIWLILWAGLPIVREWAPVPSGTFALVESDLPALPAGVPSGAQSVPLLMLDSNLGIRVGMMEHEVTGHAFARYAAGPMLSERGVLGDRAILPFRYGPSRFWVVLDRTEAGREREVTAIYVK